MVTALDATPPQVHFVLGKHIPLTYLIGSGIPSTSDSCSSFLGIQTSTVYTTTVSTSYVTDIESTITGTNTLTAPTVTLPTVTLPTVTAPTTTITETAGATTVTTCDSSVTMLKRHLPTARRSLAAHPRLPEKICLHRLFLSPAHVSTSPLQPGPVRLYKLSSQQQW